MDHHPECPMPDASDPDHDCASYIAAAKEGISELRRDATDRAPDPNDPAQAAAAAAQAGPMMPCALALLGPEVGSEVRNQVGPDGQAWVVVRIEHATGSSVVGLTPGHARILANNLHEQARQAELAGRKARNGGLVVVEKRLQTPPGT